MSSSKAFLTPIDKGGVVRVIPGGRYGDPYSFSCTYEIIDGETVELLGVMSLPNFSDMRALLRAFWEDGYKYLQWHRIKGDKVTIKKLRTRP